MELPIACFCKSTLTHVSLKTSYYKQILPKIRQIEADSKKKNISDSDRSLNKSNILYKPINNLINDNGGLHADSDNILKTWKKYSR